jgi:hypothetical protein
MRPTLANDYKGTPGRFARMEPAPGAAKGPPKGKPIPSDVIHRARDEFYAIRVNPWPDSPRPPKRKPKRKSGAGA